MELNQRHTIKFQQFLQYLASTDLLPADVILGGYQRNRDYGFTSQEKTPWERSFSIQGDQLVLIGWPRFTDCNELILATLRKKLEAYGLRHKWHRKPHERDNDLYFVLGDLAHSISHAIKIDLEHSVREFLASSRSLVTTLSISDLYFARYTRTQLPLTDTVTLSLQAAISNPEKLIDMYSMKN